MGTLMSHVEHLSETIGPRPAATDAEVRAADYIRDVFESRGLDAELQPFESPRTYTWTYVLFHLLTIGAALLSRYMPWPAAALAALSAVLMWLDLETRTSLSAIMPKRPSQNVIARHVPKAGRGERVQKVVVVAHYDSARSSLAFSPGMVKNFAVTFGLMKWCTVAVPVLIVAGRLPFVNAYPQIAWYVALAPAAYLVIPLLINVHRELFMRFTPGANDNASGVAAMLGLLERLVPEPDAATLVARETARMRTEEEAWAADVVPDGALLSYSPVAAPEPRVESWADDDEISWDTGVISGQTAMRLDHGASASPEPDAGPAAMTPDAITSARLFGTGPIVSRPAEPSGSVWETGPSAPVARAPRGEAATRGRVPDLGFDVDFDDAPARGAGREPQADADAAPEAATRGGVRDWLGVGTDFDARKRGRDIGSWDNFTEDDDTDEAGWKGGAASAEGLDDPDFAASEAARIRRKVTMNVDRELVEKEVWFVATGAEEVGTVGMKAFLKQYGPDLRDAVIVNLDNLGAGSLAYVTREGMWKRYESDRRLTGAAKRAVREADLPIRGREYRGLSTDATAALARGFRAMSVMAFDINGRLPNWHWASDIAGNVLEDNLTTAVDFVAAVIKEL